MEIIQYPLVLQYHPDEILYLNKEKVKIKGIAFVKVYYTVEKEDKTVEVVESNALKKEELD